MGVHEIATPTRAVFFDRDGTLIRFIENAVKPSHIKLILKAAEAIKKLRGMGFLCVVATNQPCVEKGLITKKQADALNALLLQKLRDKGAMLDAVYMCPHKYPSGCRCRKPKTGMIQAAKRKFHIDIERSYIVGDTRRDVQTGINAGLTTILVRSGPEWNDRSLFDVEADYTVANITEAVTIIAKQS